MKKKLLLVTIICFVFSISFIILHSNLKKDNKIRYYEINILWEKFDTELNSLNTKIDLLTNESYSDYLLMQLQTFINRYYNTRNNSGTYSESIYNYKLRETITNEDIKNLNQKGLYFSNYYGFYQDINNYKDLILNNNDKSFAILNNYFNLFINYYDLKIVNYNESFNDILENEIILLQYINLIADWLIEIK